MDIGKTFPARYWINLGRRQERRADTEWRLHKAGITAERFPAVDARFVRKIRGYESAGRYALALSQRLAIRKAMLAGAEAVLLLEDDVVFHPELLERLEGIELPDDWGILYLGCAHRRRPSPVADGLVRTPYALDTHAFAVRAPYYRRVISALGRRDEEACRHPRASDWFLANLHGEIPTYACYPNLVWQEVSSSDLMGGTYSNYTPDGEQISSHGETIALQSELWGVRRWQAWSRPELGDVDGEPPTTSANPATSADPGSRIDPKLGLLFLTHGDVNHPDLWQDFIRQAGDGVRVFSHPKDPAAAAHGFLANTAIPENVETKWGDISLVRAMLPLLRNGLADPSLTHFMFLSESCVPIRPWREMRRSLLNDPRSMIPYQGHQEMSPLHLERILKVRDLPAHTRRVHPQWILLDREAATCVAETDLTGRFERVFAADEHYFGTVLALRGFPNERIRRQAATWVEWKDAGRDGGPKEVSQLSWELMRELSGFSGFFARKFPVGSDIGKWGLHRGEPT